MCVSEGPGGVDAGYVGDGSMGSPCPEVHGVYYMCPSTCAFCCNILDENCEAGKTPCCPGLSCGGAGVCE